MILYWVETQRVERLGYAVESDEPISQGKLQEMIDTGIIAPVDIIANDSLGEKIVGVQEINHKTFIKKFDESQPDVAYLDETSKLLNIRNVNEMIEIEEDTNE